MGDLYDDEILPGSTIPPPVAPSPIQRKPLPKRAMATGGLWDDQEQAPQQSSGGLWDDEQPATLAPEQQPIEPTGPAPEGPVMNMLRGAVPKIIPGLMELGGGTLGGIGGALVGNVPGAVAGTIAGGVAAGAVSGKVNEWVASKLFTPEHIAEFNAQNEANRRVSPLLVGAGEMVGAAPSMLTGSGLARNIPKLAAAAKLSQDAIKAGKTAEEARKIYNTAAGAARYGGKLLEAGVGMAVMGGGSDARDNPDATLYSTLAATIKGGITGAPLGLLPHAKSIAGMIAGRAPLAATEMAVGSALYDHFVSGTPIDLAAIKDQAMTDLPMFAIMEAFSGALGRAPLLPKSVKKLSEAKTPGDVLKSPEDVHTVLAQAMDALVTPEPAAKEAEPVTETPSGAATVPVVASAEKASSPVVPDAGAGVAPVPAVAVTPPAVARRPLPGKTRKPARPPVQAVEPVAAPMAQPVVEKPAAVAGGETVKAIEPVAAPAVESVTGGKSFVDRLLKDDAQRRKLEAEGMDILDSIEESGRTPDDVVSEFDRTYESLNDAGRQQIDSQLKKYTGGMKPGDVIGSMPGPNGTSIPWKAEKWSDILQDSVQAGTIGKLEGTDRGLVSIMERLNIERRKYDAVAVETPRKIEKPAVPEPAPTPAATPKASLDGLRKLRADVVKYNDLAYRARLPMGDAKDAAKYEALSADASGRLAAAEAQAASEPTPAARKPLVGKSKAAKAADEPISEKTDYNELVRAAEAGTEARRKLHDLTPIVVRDARDFVASGLDRSTAVITKWLADNGRGIGYVQPHIDAMTKAFRLVDAVNRESKASDELSKRNAEDAKPAAVKPPATDAEIAAGFTHTVTSSALKKASFQDLKHFAKIAKYPDGGTVEKRAIGKSAIALRRALREHRETYEKFAGIKKREYTPERLAQMREQGRKMIQARREKQANDQAEYFINLKAEKDKKVFDAKIADGTLIPVGGSVEIKGEFGEVRTVDGMHVDASGKIIYHVTVDGEIKMVPEDQVVDLGKPSEVLNDAEFDFGYNEAGEEGTPGLAGVQGRSGGGEAVQRRGEEVQDGTGASAEAAARPELRALEVQTPEQVAAENKAKAKRDQDAAEIARRAAAPLPAGQGDVGAGDLFGEGGVAPGELALSRRDTIEKPKTGMAAIPKRATESQAEQAEQPKRPRVEVKSPIANLSAEKQARYAALQAKLLKNTLGRSNMFIDPENISIMTEMAGLHIEGGVKTFEQFAINFKADTGDLWDSVKNHLRMIWEGASTAHPEVEEISRADAAKVIAKIDSQLTKENSDAPGQPDGVEQDSPNTVPTLPVGEGDVQPVTGRGPENTGNGGETPERERPTGKGRRVLPKRTTVAGGARGNSKLRPVKSTTGTGATGSSEPARGNEVDVSRPDALAERAEAVAEPSSGDAGPVAGDMGEANQAGASRVERQRTADREPVVTRDRKNIVKTLPLLHEGQQEDVGFAEDRFAKPDGYGVMFTNGTGTGKTYTGMGVIKRMVQSGKSDILVLAPSDQVMAGWVASGKDLGLDISILPDTNSAGSGVTITTYANLSANNALAKRNWNLIVADESHYLSSNKEGGLTSAAMAVRALSMHPNGKWQRAKMLHPEAYATVEAANKSGNVDAINRAMARWEPLQKGVFGDVDAAQGEKRPRVMFLSATPFAYVKNIEYAEGYLFNYKAPGAREDQTGYNQGNPRDRFFMTHFGYRMRFNKLTAPEAGVDADIMERGFNEFLRKNSVLSRRMLDVKADYQRKFATVDDLIGKKIDEGTDFLNNARDGRYYSLAKVLSDKFDYHSKMFLLESLKARHSVDIIKDQIARGRKVVVFHDFNVGGGFNPFNFDGLNREIVVSVKRPNEFRRDHVKLGQLVDEFKAAKPDLQTLDFNNLRSPIGTLGAEFKNALFVNGTISKGNRREAIRLFNDDNSGRNLIVVQNDAGREGISLHDTTGAHRRVEINLGLPVRPTAAIQEEGRIYRTGQHTGSHATFMYMNTGTNFERFAFAQKIFERSATAENLAMGNEARTLRQSFIDAFESAEPYQHSENDGTGGKEKDRQMAQQLTEFDKAKSYYFANQKKTARTKSAEGVDYFATPEPIGQKMVEWLRLKSNENALEPSAGHGAISRWLPENTNNTIIEPSAELLSRAALATNARTIQDRFENHDIHNKYHGIAMNPPFGHGGKTAVEHVAKAFTHLKEGGRIVAIIPEGPSADKHFSNWSDATKDAIMVASVSLPPSTFERAGTSVRTRIIVIDRVPESYAKRPDQAGRMELSGESIGDVFNSIENMSMPDRVKETFQPAFMNRDTIIPRADEVRKPLPRRTDAYATMANGAETTTTDAAPTTTAEQLPITSVQHTKKNTLIHIAVPTKYMNRDQYEAVKQAANKMGGWYSRKFGTSPNGFAFEDKAKAEEFARGHREFFRPTEQTRETDRGTAMYARGEAFSKDPVDVPRGSLTPEVLARMSKIAKREGFDSRGAADVKEYLVTGRKVKIGDQGYNKESAIQDGKIKGDWAAFYREATKGVSARIEKLENKKQEQEQHTHVNRERIRELGYTTDLREAGYITPEGNLIDLSGKREGGTPGTRSYDHREAGDTSGMLEFMAEGNIRMDMNSGMIDLGAAPTDKQLNVIEKIIEKHNGAVTIDAATGTGEWDKQDKRYSNAPKVLSKMYDEGTKARRILNDIRGAYGMNRYAMGDTSTGPGLTRPDFDAALAEETKGMKFAGENVTSGISGEAPEWAKAAEGQAAKDYKRQPELSFLSKSLEVAQPFLDDPQLGSTRIAGELWSRPEALANLKAARGIADRAKEIRFMRDTDGTIRALTIGNRSHFFLDRYDSPDQLRQDIREEAMHRVVNELGGPAWQKAASQVYGGTRAAMIVAEIKRNYGFKLGTEAFNHELLAKMVRDGQQNAGAWRRTVDAVVSMLRNAGRRLGLDLNMTDAELRNLANGLLRAKERQMAGGGENKPTLSGRTLKASNATIMAPREVEQAAIAAYHGTPHTMEPEPGHPLGRFRKEKVGSGEGAAAFGWGVAYTAESKVVAEAYRKSLSSPEVRVMGQQMPVRDWGNLSPNDWVWRMLSDMRIERPNARSNELAERLLDRINQEADSKSLTDHERNAIQTRRDVLQEAMKRGLEVGNGGNLYHVEIAADPADMLDWDKPLSDQSEKVRKTLAGALDRNAGVREKITKAHGWGDKSDPTAGPIEQAPGAAIYHGLSMGNHGPFPGVAMDGPRKASEYLASIGIKGIRYADQGSRGKPSWMVKYGAGKGYTMHNSRSLADADARDNGGEVVESPQSTYNYVIFNESDIRVVGRNGEILKPSDAMGQEETAQASQTFRNPDVMQTETPKFKEWFGNSKVVDAQGKPLVVYHGTTRDFSKFDINAKRNMMMFRDSQGFYFTKDPSDASAYTEDRSTGDPSEGANVMPVYLRMVNPFRVKSGDTDNHPAYVSPERRAKLESQGYDGIDYADGLEFVVFRPEQIKSATGNRGTFDAANPDIRYARGEKREDRPSVRALSAVSRSPVEYKNLISWTRTNHGDLYDPALSDHENASRVLAGLAESAERPDGLSGMAGLAFQRFRTALGKGGGEDALQGKPEAMADTPRQREIDTSLSEKIDEPSFPAIPDSAPAVDGSTWRDVRRNEDPAYKSEREFLDDYRDNGFHEARESAEEFLKRRFCAGRS